VAWEEILSEHTQPEAVGMKYTKTALAVPGGRGDPDDGRESVYFYSPFAGMPEFPRMYPVASPWMSVPEKSNPALAFSHEGKMGAEFLFPVIKTSHVARKIGIDVMTEENVPGRRRKDRVTWQGGQEAEFLIAVSGIQILLVGPGFPVPKCLRNFRIGS
jgi:hypothetical protein